MEFRVRDFVDVKMWDGHKLSGIWHSLMESHVDSSSFAMIWWLKRKAKKKKKTEMKSYMVVKDIRCVLKLDLWPSQGWPCGCQHDLIAWNSLHVLSWTSKKLKKHDSLINKNLDAYGRTRQTRYCDIVQYRHPMATWVDLWLSTKPLQV